MNAAQLGRIRSHLEQRYLEPGKVAGFLPLVYRRGEIAIWSRSARWISSAASHAGGRSFVYSMSKPITSVALMQLYEKGNSSCDPVHRWITIPGSAGVSAGDLSELRHVPANGR